MSSEPRSKSVAVKRPYVETWEEFESLATALFEKEPDKTRFVSKYRASDGLLDLKVTDDVQIVKYKTDQAQDVKRLERFNASLMRSMIAAKH